MRQNIGQESEELSGSIFANEIERLPMNDIGCILRAVDQVVTREPHRIAVVPQIFLIIFMGERLAVVAEKLVEMLRRIALRTGSSEPPFAEGSRFVPRLAEHLAQRIGPGRKRRLPLFSAAGAVAHTAEVGPYGGMSGMQSGHQHRTRRSADRAAAIVMREEFALRSQAIDVGRLDFGLSVTPDIAVAQIVGKNIDHIEIPYLVPGRIASRGKCTQRHCRQ